MLTASLVLLTALLTTHPVEGPFQDLTLDQALAAAKKDNKVVMIDFFTTWCAPCKKLDSTTWKDADVVAWLGEKTIALRLDAEKETDIAKGHHINAYPTMLFLKSDGSEIDRLVGYKDPKEFLSNAKDALAGKDAIMRARERLVGHENDPDARGRYAQELARRGQYEEALKEYLWCFDNGRESPGYGGVRLSFLLGYITDLGRQYPPAIEALKERRDGAEARLEAGADSWDDLADFFALNGVLNSSERNLILFDHLREKGPLPDRVRFGFKQDILPQLSKEKRYKDIIDLVEKPEAFVKDSIGIFEMTNLVRGEDDEETRKMMESAREGMRFNIVQDAAPVYEAVLALKETAAANRIADRLLEFSPKGATYVTLIEAALRAEAPNEASSLAERGLAALPEKEAKAVKRAAKKIPQPK